MKLNKLLGVAVVTCLIFGVAAEITHAMRENVNVNQPDQYRLGIEDVRINNQDYREYVPSRLGDEYQRIWNMWNEENQQGALMGTLAHLHNDDSIQETRVFRENFFALDFHVANDAESDVPVRVRIIRNNQVIDEFQLQPDQMKVYESYRNHNGDNAGEYRIVMEKVGEGRCSARAMIKTSNNGLAWDNR